MEDGALRAGSKWGLDLREFGITKGLPFILSVRWQF